MFEALFSLLAATAPAVTTPPAKPASPATAPAPAVAPPIIEEIGVFSAREPHREREDPALIRQVWVFGSTWEWIPVSEFPRSLLPDSEIDTDVTMRLTIGADDKIGQCTPVEVSRYDKAAKQRVAGDPRLGPLGCDLIRKYGRYRHAIDAAGRPVVTEIARTINFRRGTRPVSIAPMPGFPSGWIGTGRYDPAAWPPQSSFTRPPLGEPKWKDFLAKAKGLPRSAATGVTMSLAADGTPDNCKIGRSSGDPRIDAATCTALMAIRYQPGGFPAVSVPFLVRWTGRDAVLVAARRTEPPRLIGGITLTETERPGGPIPDRPFARMRISLDATARPVRCEITGSNLEDAGDAASCAIVLSRAKFTIPRNAFAEPSPGGMNLRLDWQALKLVPDGY